MEMESCVPPGFRFHPTEEELVEYYLKRKINALKIDLGVITDIDLYRMEPWDIQGSVIKGEDNRDEKTLVFYRGRAPNGRKNDWIMYEYRIQTSQHGPPQEEGWVICRAFKKPNQPNNKPCLESWKNISYTTRPPPSLSQMPSYNPLIEFNQMSKFNQLPFNYQVSSQNIGDENNKLVIELPQLDSPTISTSLTTKDHQDQNSLASNNEYQEKNIYGQFCGELNIGDKLFAPQVIINMEAPSSSYYFPPNLTLVNDEQKHMS
ncbi:unnamed protein product [Withania somnifera]